MNHHPTTPPQLTLLRERILIVAQYTGWYGDMRTSLQNVHYAFDRLIDVEPDLDVARTYQADKERLIQLSSAALCQLAKDYEALANSPPHRVDPGDPNAEVRTREVVRTEFTNVYPFGRQMIEFYGPIAKPDPEEPMDTLLGAQHQAQQGGTADWFDSAKPPSEWTPKPLTDDEMIHAIVLPSAAQPKQRPAQQDGPSAPPYLESDWAGARISIIGGDFDRAKGRVT